MSDFRTLKRTSLLYSSALFLLSLPGVTGKIPGLEVSGVSAGFALLALGAAALYYFAEFVIAWHRQVQPELRGATTWQVETEADAKIAIHNFRNAIDHSQTFAAELAGVVKDARRNFEIHSPQSGRSTVDLPRILLNIERLLGEISENRVGTERNLHDVRRFGNGLLLFGVARKLQLFWFDLICPSALFLAALMHFLGLYPSLALAPSLPDVLSRAHLVPLSP